MRRTIPQEKKFFSLPGCNDMWCTFYQAHCRFQNTLYSSQFIKSRYKKQQDILKNSTGKTALSAFVLNGFHRFSLNLIGFGVFRFSPELPSAVQSFGKMSEPYFKVSRVGWMISFWVETLFWISFLHAQPVVPITSMIPLERKGDRSGVPLLQGGTFYICECPATHGLGTPWFHSPWFPSHAALVSFKKKEPRRTRRPAKKNISAHFFRTQFITLFQSPKPAQGMIHTLSLAPLGFWPTNNQLIINGCFGTGDTFHDPTLFPVPPRLYLLLFPAEHLSVSCCRLNERNLKPPIIAPHRGASRVICNDFQNPSWNKKYPRRPPAVFLEVAMIKKLRLFIDIEVTVPGMITPDLIEKAITVTNDGKHVHIDQEMLDMLQEIIRYISRHNNHHGECLSGELYSMLTEHECDKALCNHLNKKSFEQVLIDAAAGMEPEYEAFIKQLFQPDDDSKITIKQREILSYILHSCLLSPKITGAKVITVPGQVMHIQ